MLTPRGTSKHAAAFNSQRGGYRPVQIPQRIEEVPETLIDILTKLNSKQVVLPYEYRGQTDADSITIHDQKPFLWFQDLSLRVYKFCVTETPVKLELVLIISTKIFKLTPKELPSADALVRCTGWTDGTPNHFREKPDYIFSVYSSTYPPRLVPVRKFVWEISAGTEQMGVGLLHDKQYFADKVLAIYIKGKFNPVEKSLEMGSVVRYNSYNTRFTILQQLCGPAAQPVTHVKIERTVTKPSKLVRDLLALSS